jgi:AcrR family transcriptional regulator
MKENADGTGTAEALLEAGRQLFARDGYSGTSVRAITGAAGANLAAITYHFGSKRHLYELVVGSALLPLAARVEEIAGGGGAVLDRVGEVVRAYFGHLAEHPELPRLMLQELSLGSGPSVGLAEPLKRVHAALTGLVAEGQAKGEIREGPRLVLGVFILSVPVHLAILQEPLQRYVGVSLLDGPTRDAVTASAVEFVREGLRARAPGQEV